MESNEISPTNDTRGDRQTVCVVFAGLALTLILGLLSDGCYHDDDLTHFLFSRWSWWFPSYLLHIWGRPGLTVPLAAVSGFGNIETGWHVARILSALVTASAALIAARLSRRVGVQRTWLVAAFCYLQPLNTVLATTTLTENFASLYLIAACALLYARRVIAASIVFSLLLITRHEALVLLPVWGVALLFAQTNPQRKFVAILSTLWAPVLHNILFWIVFKEWPIRMFSEPGGSHEYPATSILGYLPAALSAVPPILAGFAVIGTLVMIWRGQLLIPTLAATFFLTHMLIKALGIFASGGYGRFLVVIAPLIAILCARGWQEVLTLRQKPGARPAGVIMAAVWLLGWLAFIIEHRAGRLGSPLSTFKLTALVLSLICVIAIVASTWQRKRSWLKSAGVTILAGTVAAQCLMLIRPLRLRSSALCIKEVSDWIHASQPADTPLFAPNAWFPYFANIIEHPRAHKGPLLLASMPVGTIFVWDSIYSGSDFHGLPLEATNNSAYKLLREFHRAGSSAIDVKLFRKIRETPLPIVQTRTYPRPLTVGEKPLTGIYYIHPQESWPPGRGSISGVGDRAAGETSPALPR